MVVSHIETIYDLAIDDKQLDPEQASIRIERELKLLGLYTRKNNNKRMMDLNIWEEKPDDNIIYITPDGTGGMFYFFFLS